MLLALIFPGTENSIYVDRRYFQEFSCQFDLLYYPFDTQASTSYSLKCLNCLLNLFSNFLQLCVMEFEIKGKPDNWLVFIQDDRGVEYKDNRLLVEYEIQKEVLQTTSVNNYSRAYVKFVFVRRWEYHVFNTFLQVSEI